MITKNWKNIIKSTTPFPVKRGDTNIANYSAATDIPLVDTSGASKYIGPMTSTQSTGLSSFATSKTGGGWAFGNGTTPATENDYVMEEFIPRANTTLTSAASITEDGYTKIILTMSSNIDNLVVSEIGFTSIVSYSDTIGGSVSNTRITTFLLYHDVFEPITLNTNDVCVFTVTFKNV